MFSFFFFFNIQTMHKNLQTIKNYIWLRHPTKNSEAIYGLTNLNCTVKKEEIINIRKKGSNLYQNILVQYKENHCKEDENIK